MQRAGEVRDDLVLGRLAAVDIDGPPLHRELTAVWRQELSPEGERLLAVVTGVKPFLITER